MNQCLEVSGAATSSVTESVRTSGSRPRTERCSCAGLTGRCLQSLSYTLLWCRRQVESQSVAPRDLRRPSTSESVRHWFVPSWVRMPQRVACGCRTTFARFAQARAIEFDAYGLAGTGCAPPNPLRRSVCGGILCRGWKGGSMCGMLVALTPAVAVFAFGCADSGVKISGRRPPRVRSSYVWAAARVITG